jgi:hypothetical protein
VLNHDWRRHTDLEYQFNQLHAEKWQRDNTAGWRIFLTVSAIVLTTVYFLNI